MPHSHIPIIFHVCTNFHMVNIDMPAGLGAPPLDTQHMYSVGEGNCQHAALVI